MEPGINNLLNEVEFNFINTSGVGLDEKVRAALRAHVLEKLEKFLLGEEKIDVHMTPADENGFFMEVKTGMTYFVK